MRPSELDLDWQAWFERWEAQQDCYVPQRRYRFDLMLRSADLPREGEVRILDLGCGPGPLALRAFEHYPNARILAVDFDPVLLAIGRHVAGERADRLQFLQADIRQGEWWGDYDGTFDLVLSATALHWLNADHLRQTYRRVYRVLAPGGRFLNSDHMASDDPATQRRDRNMLEAGRKAAFRASGACEWNSFWDALGRELGGRDLRKLVNAAEYWEGSEDGQPRSFHVAALRECGFDQVEFHWQCLGEAVLGARKGRVR